MKLDFLKKSFIESFSNFIRHFVNLVFKTLKLIWMLCMKRCNHKLFLFTTLILLSYINAHMQLSSSLQLLFT